jgi:hypothetical protein
MLLLSINLPAVDQSSLLLSVATIDLTAVDQSILLSTDHSAYVRS